MGSISADNGDGSNHARAIFRFATPDPNITAHDRALFASAAPKSVTELTLPLYDLRSPSSQAFLPLGQPGLCLEKHGFTFLTHSVPATALGTTDSVETEYLPEIERMMKEVTGCKTVLINSVGFRRKKPAGYTDPMFYHKRGGEFDRTVGSVPGDRMMGEFLSSCAVVI